MTKTDFDIQTEVMRKFNYTVKQKAVPICGDPQKLDLKA